MLIKALYKNSTKINYLGQYWIFILFLVLALVIWLTGTDQALFLIINRKHGLFPDKFWEIVNFLSYSKFAILPILLLFITTLKRRNKLINVIVLIIAYFAVFTLFKSLFGKARPYIVLAKDSFFFLNNFENSMKSAYHSFPSAHTGNIAISHLLSAQCFLKIIVSCNSNAPAGNPSRI